MPFTKVQSEKLAGAVVRQIELLILRGILKSGERLPAERELSERLGVSRPSLREAVAELHARGLLESRAGSGIYVATGLAAQFPPALIRLFARHEDAVSDYIAFRRDMEGLAVERAALYGSDTDLKVVDAVFEKMAAAHAKRDPSEEAALDAEFHMAIVEACHNVVMLHVMRSMFDLSARGDLLQPPGHVPAADDAGDAARPAPGDQRRAPETGRRRRAGRGLGPSRLCPGGTRPPAGGREERGHRAAAL